MQPGHWKINLSWTSHERYRNTCYTSNPRKLIATNHLSYRNTSFWKSNGPFFFYFWTTSNGPLRRCSKEAVRQRCHRQLKKQSSFLFNPFDFCIWPCWTYYQAPPPMNKKTSAGHVDKLEARRYPEQEHTSGCIRSSVYVHLKWCKSHKLLQKYCYRWN